MNPKALSQTAGKMVLPFTELRKTEGRAGLLGLYQELHFGEIKFQVLFQVAVSKRDNR